MVKFAKANASDADFTVTLNFMGGEVHIFEVSDVPFSVPATTDEGKKLVKFLKRNPRLKVVK